MKEVTDQELKASDLLDSITMLMGIVQTQNDVLITILHQMDIKDPGWKSKEEVEAEIKPKIEMCTGIVGKLYGTGEADKS